MPARCPKCHFILQSALADFQDRCPRCSSPLDPFAMLAAVQELKREFADRDRLKPKPKRPQ